MFRSGSSCYEACSGSGGRYDAIGAIERRSKTDIEVGSVRQPAPDLRISRKPGAAARPPTAINGTTATDATRGWPLEDKIVGSACVQTSVYLPPSQGHRQ